MKLELKESNSPFWLIGVGKGRTFAGSNTNIPCYAKSLKKQKELAIQVCKNDKNVEEVYLITGTHWDNMPSGVKEEFGYIKNKGKLILSRADIENNKEEVKECDYPKGVSRESLPKKGAKIYTSPATPLESKKPSFKPELKDIEESKEKETEVEESQEIVTEAIPYKAIATAIIYAVDNWDVLKDIIDTIKSTSKEVYDKAIAIYDYLKGKNVDVKEAAQEIGDLIASDVATESLTESKIVTPVGNPQTASSFVNIDVDLDHMEVSDFIVRLAQSIRSEQTSVLEYVALRSASGITNEDRAVIDGIIEEEKNHMVAFTTLLYKQIIENHQQNVDGANEEFTLPKFGMEIFDNTEDGKLTESIATTVEKLAVKEVGVRMSDEYFIGNTEDGRMYHGLGVAMDVIKNHICTSSEPLTIQNISLTESANLTEDNFSDFNEFLKEIGTDTNYDEIAYHIREYSKNDKDKALKMMDLLFDLENKNKTPKECVNEIISTFGEKAEDVNITGYSETMSQDQYEIEVDVDYDVDFQGKVATNIVNAIHDMNPTTFENDKYAIAEDEGKTKLGDKLSFELLVYNGFDKEVDEEFIKSIVKRLLDKASTYEHYVTLK